MIYHCTKCHHEWMAVAGKEEKKKCDWCGAKGKRIGTDYTDRRGDKQAMETAWKRFFEERK